MLDYFVVVALNFIFLHVSNIFPYHSYVRTVTVLVNTATVRLMLEHIDRLSVQPSINIFRMFRAKKYRYSFHFLPRNFECNSPGK